MLQTAHVEKVENSKFVINAMLSKVRGGGVSVSIKADGPLFPRVGLPTLAVNFEKSIENWIAFSGSCLRITAREVH